MTCHSCMHHCSLIFYVSVTNTTQQSDNTKQQTADNVRRYSIAGAKINRLWLGLVGGEESVAYMRYFHSSIEVPHTADPKN